MLLTVDIGNTNITFGIFDNEILIDIFRLPSNRDLNGEEYEVLLHTLFKSYNIDACIIASVVNELENIMQGAVNRVFRITPLVISNKINLGINIKLAKPQELGADRIANACGAYILYKKPVIIVDLGTATTFDIIDGNGDFVGGVIMPGLNLQLQALYQNTSKLPRIDINSSENAIGDCTEKAILSGVIRGTACAISGLIEQCKVELNSPKTTVVATGGYSEFISKYMKQKFDFINPYLTLEGLRFLYELNK